MVTTAHPPPIGEEAAFNAVRPRAAALDEREIRKRGDAQLALDNVLTALDAILARRADLELTWAPARVDALGGVRQVALATVFASSRALQLDDKEKVLSALISRMYDARGLLNAVLDMGAAWGLLPGERVAAIRSGKGPQDGGQDLVDGVALVREFADALAGKTPITPQFLAGAEALGNDVVVQVRDSNARLATNTTARDAAGLANRIWTLLVQGHAELRKAGFELWGDALDAFVPPLQSHNRSRGPAKPKTPTDG